MKESKEYFEQKVVAVLGYNEDGQEQARELREQGIRVIVGLKEGDPYWSTAEADGFAVNNLFQAVQQADIIQVWY